MVQPAGCESKRGLKITDTGNAAATRPASGAAKFETLYLPEDDETV